MRATAEAGAGRRGNRTNFVAGCGRGVVLVAVLAGGFMAGGQSSPTFTVVVPAAAASQGHVDGLPGGEFARARATSTEILARREFQAAAGPSWLDVQVAKFWSWIGRIFSGVNKLGKLAPWLGTAIEWSFFVGAAVGLLVFMWRNFARQRLRVSMGLGVGDLQSGAWAREAEDWARMAEERAAAREWRDAVHCLYWAAIVLLESRRAWRHNPSRTPREYVRLLRAGSAQQGALRGLTGIFERTWYGLRDAEEADFRRARGFFDGLSGEREAVVRTAEGRA
jgi:Domain of unknown function (DUF4129)